MNKCTKKVVWEIIFFLFLTRKYAYNKSTMIDNFFLVELEANVYKDKTLLSNNIVIHFS